MLNQKLGCQWIADMEIVMKLLQDGEWWCMKIMLCPPWVQELLAETPSPGHPLHLMCFQLRVLPRMDYQNPMKAVETQQQRTFMPIET